MKTRNIVFIAMIAILLSMVSLYATGHSGHCGKCEGHSEIEEVEVTGRVTKTDTCLTLTEQGKETVLKLVFSEEMEAKADSIDTQSIYTFKGKLSNSGKTIFVSQFSELTQTKTAGYQVIPEKCIGCRLCVRNCPENAIKMVDGKAVIDQEKCVDCGICKDGNGKFKGCPVKAIEKSK